MGAHPVRSASYACEEPIDVPTRAEKQRDKVIIDLDKSCDPAKGAALVLALELPLQFGSESRNRSPEVAEAIESITMKVQLGNP